MTGQTDNTQSQTSICIYTILGGQNICGMGCAISKTFSITNSFW